MSDTTRSKAEIEAEIAAARERLAANVEGLFMQVHPKAVVANKVADARSYVSGRANAVRSELVARSTARSRWRRPAPRAPGTP